MAEMTVAEALAFVDELVLLDDDCTRPELAMRVLAAEVRRLQAEVNSLEMRPTRGELRQAERERLEWKAEVERLTRERGAAIEAAFREGWEAGFEHEFDTGATCDCDWAASKARKETR